jgi:hypothetical protein
MLFLIFKTMLTPEQNKEITRYLVAKNLPIDLVLEVKDHMIEQIENMENVSFEDAFEEVKLSWKEELKMVFSLKSPFRKLTKFQKKIVKKTEYKILIKSIKLFLPFLVLSIMITLYNKELSKTINFIVYLIIAIITVLSMIFYNKTYRTINLIKKKYISIYQGSSQLYFLSGMYVIIFNLLNFDVRFEKFYNSVYSILNWDLDHISLLSLLATYIFIFFWLIGLFYFLNYKKTITELKNRIKLKL